MESRQVFSRLERLRDMALRSGASFAEVRLNERDVTSIAMQDGNADKLHQSATAGLGVRVLVDGAWGFASSNGLDESRGDETVSAAIAGARATRMSRTEEAAVANQSPVEAHSATKYEKDPRQISLSDKMEALVRLDRASTETGADKLVNRALVYADSYQRETLVNSFGSAVQSEYIRTQARSSVVVQDGGIRQKGQVNKAEQAGFEMLERLDPSDFTARSAREAISLLTARKAPSGKFPVIFHPSITGLLTHEALGHNAEADHITAGTSILEGKLGQQVASPLVTIIDDATMEKSWGSYFYDSEGTPGERRVLIENGRLVGFMHNLETAAKMGVSPNGSGRAQDYDCPPIVRMSNTFIASGQSTVEEMLKDIELGVFLTGGNWGYVFCERGQFTCNAGGGWMIRNGELAEPIRDACVSGLTLETLANIDMVSSNFEMSMPGMCGKCGQGMPVNAGGPHVRVKELVVGGQEAA